MSRTVFCTFLNREAEGLDFQSYPGDLGKRIYDHISKRPGVSGWPSKPC